MTNMTAMAACTALRAKSSESAASTMRGARTQKRTASPPPPITARPSGPTDGRTARTAA
ncbi:Uncharacterised protein [Mycobacteroides abscessus]|mgnify:CR=1 FL=1|nr:Uncharacterised protein [Mycobacteroides abscessus]